MGNTMTSRSLALLAGLGLALGGVACGDDGGSNSSKPPKRPKRKAAAAAAAPVKASLGTYPKVGADLRHSFTELDFVSDPTGETNRDPFRSWILQPQVEEGPDLARPEDVCTDGKVRWGAQNHSVRALSLIGLVKRGRSYAQFTDSGEKDSWIVRKGDCIGQEKAIIEEVGVGYVRLSITPPAPPGAPAPAPQKQDIPLHPDELEIPDSILSSFDEEE